MNTRPAEHDLLRAKLNGETSRMPWREMLRFFAAGHVVVVDDTLDLVEVAVCVASDDKAVMAAWLESGQVAKATDAQAGAWLDTDVELWTVVVKPWVLVQYQKNESNSTGTPPGEGGQA